MNAADPKFVKDNKRRFVEDFALLLERSGVTPLAGRIWGWLLVCDPPHQSAAQLAEALGASLGGISTMTRLLVEFGIVERIGVPGERSRYYRVRPGGFSGLLTAKMQMTTEFRALAERGLAMMADEPAEALERLEECRDFYAFFEQEFPALIARWESERKEEL